MSIGTWEDFTDKYGFNDGASIEGRDFRARDYLVEDLNTRQELKNAHLTACAWDRSGMHNECLIVMLPNPDGLAAPELLKRWLDGPPVTGDFDHLPDLKDPDINEMISECYARADEDNDAPKHADDTSLCGVTGDVEHGPDCKYLGNDSWDCGKLDNQPQDDTPPASMWLAIYDHRHGNDYAIFDHEPTQDEMAEYWKDEYEPDREDEYFGTYHAPVVKGV